MTGKHDLVTAGVLAALAFMAADLSHEVLGHGSIALLEHAKEIDLCYTALSTDATGRVLVLAGPLVNLVLGIAAYTMLRVWRFRPALEWFLFLFASMSLLNLSSYMILSGVTGTGDLAVALAGMQNIGAIRWIMGLFGLVSYIAIVPVFGRIFGSFSAPRLPLCAIAYLAPLLLNTLAALLSPLGLYYYLLSALPATAGVNLYLFFLPGIAGAQAASQDEAVIHRSLPMVVICVLLAAMFILFLGRGIRLRG